MQDELARAVGKLPQDHFDTAMSLIVARHPELHPGSEDMVRAVHNSQQLKHCSAALWCCS